MKNEWMTKEPMNKYEWLELNFQSIGDESMELLLWYNNYVQLIEHFNELEFAGIFKGKIKYTAFVKQKKKPWGKDRKLWGKEKKFYFAFHLPAVLLSMTKKQKSDYYNRKTKQEDV